MADQLISFPYNPALVVKERSRSFANLLRSFAFGGLFILAASVIWKTHGLAIIVGVLFVDVLIIVQEADTFVTTSELVLENDKLRIILLNPMVISLGITWISLPAWHTVISWGELSKARIREEGTVRDTFWSSDKRKAHEVQIWSLPLIYWLVGLHRLAFVPCFVITSEHQNYQHLLDELRKIIPETVL